jgi:hypothetical protein
MDMERGLRLKGSGPVMLDRGGARGSHHAFVVFILVICGWGLRFEISVIPGEDTALARDGGLALAVIV